MRLGNATQHIQHAVVVCFATQHGMSRFWDLSLGPSPSPIPLCPFASLLTKHFRDKMYLYAICFCAVVVEKIYKNCALFICGVALFCTHLRVHAAPLPPSPSFCLFCLFSLYLYRRKGYVKFVQWLTWPMYCRVYNLQIWLMSLYAWWSRRLHELQIWNLLHRLLNIWCNCELSKNKCIYSLFNKYCSADAEIKVYCRVYNLIFYFDMILCILCNLRKYVGYRSEISYTGYYIYDNWNNCKSSKNERIYSQFNIKCCKSL